MQAMFWLLKKGQECFSGNCSPPTFLSNTPSLKSFIKIEIIHYLKMYLAETNSTSGKNLQGQPDM